MSVDSKKRLGRGLEGMLPSGNKAVVPVREATSAAIEDVHPNRDQPRSHFDDTALDELAASIRAVGVLEPILVRKRPGGGFEIVAGERRWRASQRAGLKEVLVVVKDVSPKAAFELALVENLQRADLNPIEIAEAYDRLLREHAYSHESLAERMGKDRSTITNALRLLKLPTTIRSLVISRELSEGHARALLGAPDDKTLIDLADKTVRGRLAVRKLEALVRAAKDKKAGVKTPPAGAARNQKSAAIRDLEARLARRLGTRVEVNDEAGAGHLAIHYGSLDELDRILAFLGA